MCEKRSVELFVTESIRRIQIALAVALLKSKPKNVTAVEYATTFQKKFLEQNESATELEPTILSFEQDRILARLQAMFCKTTSSNEDNMTSLGDMNTIAADVQNGTDVASVSSVSNCVSDMDTSEDVSIMTETNLKFIQAIIQLKSALNTSSTITSTELKIMLMSVGYPCLEGFTQDKTSVTMNPISQSEIQPIDPVDLFWCKSLPSCSEDTQHSSDSGFFSYPSVYSESENVSSSALRYVIRSANTDQVLLKSVTSVLTYVETSILSDNLIVLENIVITWTGSVLEYAVSVLVELIDCVSVQEEGCNSCLTVCFNFLKKVINNIGEGGEVYVYTVFEHRCVVVVEMCNSIYLCVNTIDYILEQILLTSQKLNPDISVVDDRKNAERAFYLFNLLEMLLKKHNFFKDSKCGGRETKQKEHTNVMEVWKVSWSHSTKNMLTQNVQASLMEYILKWKDMLEESVKILPDEFVNIAMYSLACLMQIEQTYLSRTFRNQEETN